MAATDDLLSVIIRSSSPTRLRMLDEAVFSVVVQDWRPVEIVICLQNPSTDFVEGVEAIASAYGNIAGVSIAVQSVEIPQGLDGRARLLNHGIGNSKGRYLAFLDDDDIVYGQGYSILIGNLQSDSEAALSAGRCRTSEMVLIDGVPHVKRKLEQMFDWGSHKFDLMKDNFIPIHSYVLDRSRIEMKTLRFVDEAVPLEDYDFLLRLSNGHQFDLTARNRLVCEYRLHTGNTIWAQTSSFKRVPPSIRKARLHIDGLKENLLMTVSRVEFDSLSLTAPVTRSETSRANPARRLLYRMADTAYQYMDHGGALQSFIYRVYRRFRGLR